MLFGVSRPFLLQGFLQMHHRKKAARYISDSLGV